MNIKELLTSLRKEEEEKIIEYTELIQNAQNRIKQLDELIVASD